MEKRNQNAPIYLQLREVIRTKIEEEEYLPGTAIPSENALAETYGINRLTVRSAIDTLVKEGLLRRVQGKGVFVVGEKLEQNLYTLDGFSKTIRRKNKTPKVKVLVKSLRPAGGRFAKIFGIGEEEPVFYIKRICYVEDTPFSLEDIYIPEYILPELINVDLAVFSIYETYEFFGVELKQAFQTLNITHLNKKGARALGIDAALPVFMFECTSYDNHDRAIEYTRTYTREDLCGYTVNFYKNQADWQLPEKLGGTDSVEIRGTKTD